MSLPRRFAGYLLTSSLGRDALGETFRGVTLSEQRRPFVRLRLFDSPELPLDRVVAAFEAQRELLRPFPDGTLEEEERLGVAEGTPYLVWTEANAYSLDRVIEAARAGASAGPMTPEHALLVADRIASALERAARAGRSAGRHGLVWPGFVTIGADGAVRLGGFGVAPAILPYLSEPRLSVEIAPYVAPEMRRGGPRPDSADVYSVAAITAELLTGRRPDGSHPAAFLTGSESGERVPLPRGISDALRAALAPESMRTPGISILRREIGQALVSERLSPSSRELGEWTSARLAQRPSGSAPRARLPLPPERDAASRRDGPRQ